MKIRYRRQHPRNLTRASDVLLARTARDSGAVDLANLWVVVGGVIALGAGIAGGSWIRFPAAQEPKQSGPGQVEVVTLSVNPGERAKPEAAKPDFRAQFGLTQHKTFEGAREQLDELLEKFSRIGAHQLYQSPLESERILQEIESILSLADESRLLDLFDSVRPGDGSDFVRGSIMTALARLSPEIAATRWLELSNAPEASGLLVPVMVEWLDRDSRAAKGWIESLDGKERDAAHHASLIVLARSDPGRVVKELTLNDSARGSALAMVLGSYLDASQMAETATLIAKAPEGKSASKDMLGSFVSSWSKREPEAAMEWMLSQDLENMDPQVVSTALAPVVMEDPEGFLGQISPQLSESPALTQLAGRAWWTWLTAEDSNSTDAMAWMADHLDSATGFAEYQIADYFSRSEQWTPERTSQAMEALSVLPKTDAGNAFLQDFLERLARYQPKIVLPYAVELLPLGSQSNSTIAQAVGSWAKEDPMEAIQWTLEHFPTEGGRSDAIRFSMGRWAETDPKAAADYALTLPEKHRGSALWGLANNWASRDPDGVIDYVKTASDPAMVSSLTKGAFRELAESKKPANYFREAVSMPPGKLRHDAVRGLFGGWALSAPKEAVGFVDKVPEGPLRNTAIQGFNEYAARSDPKTSLDLATRITVPAARDRELLFRARDWIKKNPKEARDAIRAHPGIPDELKEKLLP